jgi:hypothetical protein
MARLARIVVPGLARYVTGRGNRRQPVFFGEDDSAEICSWVSQNCWAAYSAALLFGRANAASISRRIFTAASVAS